MLKLYCWCCTLKWQLKQSLVEFYPEVAWEKYSQIHTKLISPVWYWEWLKEMALACKTSTFHKYNASETEHQRKKKKHFCTSFYFSQNQVWSFIRLLLQNVYTFKENSFLSLPEKYSVSCSLTFGNTFKVCPIKAKNR